MENKTISLIGRKCVQCHICEIVCPTNSISFVKNEKGFLVPTISNSCVNCGKCYSSCPSMQADENKCYNEPLKTLYGFSKDRNQLLKSSSGGIFYLLAKKAASLGFDVISTVYKNDFTSCFYSNIDDSTIEAMRQSKYCESDFSNVIKRIKNNLLCNKKTLVCGTPCHIDAIRGLFGFNENILLIDFVCHGVPSSLLMSNMISFYEKKLHGKVNAINFRYKESKNSNSLCLFVSSKKKSIVVPWDSDRFYFAFQKYWILRDSCYFCRFIDKHDSDITLGDFWDFKKIGVDIDNKSGCSLIFINTLNGDKIIKDIANEINVSELSSRNYYSVPHKRQEDYNKQVLFFELYKHKGFIKTCDYLFFKKQKVKIFLKKIIKF